MREELLAIRKMEQANYRMIRTYLSLFTQTIVTSIKFRWVITNIVHKQANPNHQIKMAHLLKTMAKLWISHKDLKSLHPQVMKVKMKMNMDKRKMIKCIPLNLEILTLKINLQIEDLCTWKDRAQQCFLTRDNKTILRRPLTVKNLKMAL